MFLPDGVPREAVRAAAEVFAQVTGSTTAREEEALRLAIEAALPLLQFSPLGDNHHAALACPYCWPPEALDRMARAMCVQEHGEPPDPSGMESWREKARRVLRAVRSV
jgi:hypothetical protein